ncbi:hypothetical protein F8S09_17160, partial [Deinococcus sp. SDU3-2]|nr:hypothetical protein [Deinococcus terrestris]
PFAPGTTTSGCTPPWATPAPGLGSWRRRSLATPLEGFSGAVPRELGIANQTVQNGLTRVFQKLGVSSRNEAILYYWDIANKPPIQ